MIEYMIMLIAGDNIKPHEDLVFSNAKGFEIWAMYDEEEVSWRTIRVDFYDWQSTQGRIDTFSKFAAMYGIEL